MWNEATLKKPVCSKGKHVAVRSAGHRAYYIFQQMYWRFLNLEPTRMRWKHRRKSFDFAKAPVYIDMGKEGVFERTWHNQTSNVLYGWVHTREEFAEAAGLTWRADAVDD